MALDPLFQVLEILETKDNWKIRQQFKQLSIHWVEVVGTVVAAQTRPTGIRRGVLYVATSSPVWAQNLIFERRRILEKLNPSLATPISDIRFSSAQWHSERQQRSLNDIQQDEQSHPSWVDPKAIDAKLRPVSASQSPNHQDPTAAFQQWTRVIQARSQHLPICHQCKCHTPSGELERWGVCALCAIQQW
jgi:predicted nucleic acid-binding Zn ribbon protein